MVRFLYPANHLFPSVFLTKANGRPAGRPRVRPGMDAGTGRLHPHPGRRRGPPVQDRGVDRDTPRKTRAPRRMRIHTVVSDSHRPLLALYEESLRRVEPDVELVVHEIGQHGTGEYGTDGYLPALLEKLDAMERISRSRTDRTSSDCDIVWLRPFTGLMGSFIGSDLEAVFFQRHGDWTDHWACAGLHHPGRRYLAPVWAKVKASMPEIRDDDEAALRKLSGEAPWQWRHLPDTFWNHGMLHRLWVPRRPAPPAGWVGVPPCVVDGRRGGQARDDGHRHGHAQAMTTSIFIRTYDKDAVAAVLPAVAAHVRHRVRRDGRRHPKESDHAIRPLAEEFGCRYGTCPRLSHDDYIGQQATKMTADN